MKVLELYVCLLMATVGSVWSQSSPCCVPDQWEGVQHTVVGLVIQGKGQVDRVRSSTSYDYTNGRIATFSNISTDTAPEQRFFSLILYSTNTEYNLDLTSGLCTKQSLSGIIKRQCIPENSTKVEDMYFGSASETPLMATEYSFEVPLPSGGLTGTVAFTKQCIPVTETLYGQINGEQLLQATEFVDIQLGISHPDVFNIPQACQKAPIVLQNPQRLPGILSV